MKHHIGIKETSEHVMGFPSGSVINNLPANAGNERDVSSIPGLGRFLEEVNGNPLQFFPRKSHGQRSQVGYCAWGRKQLDTEAEHARTPGHVAR